MGITSGFLTVALLVIVVIYKVYCGKKSPSKLQNSAEIYDNPHNMKIQWIKRQNNGATGLDLDSEENIKNSSDIRNETPYVQCISALDAYEHNYIIE